MDLIDWVAVFGAFAWLPHMLRFIRDYFAIAKVRIITGNPPEIGYTTLGPIVNLRVAFVVERTDLVISAIRIRVVHEGGDEQIFGWRGVVQMMGTMTYPEMRVPFERESNVLALKARTSEVDERFIRFQGIEYIKGKMGIERDASTRLMYLRRGSGKVDVKAFLNCDEMTDLYSYIKRNFWWKEGFYTVTFEIDSPCRFHMLGRVYTFSLSSVDIEELEKNKDQVERSYAFEMKPKEESEDVPMPAWVWRYPELRPEGE